MSLCQYLILKNQIGVGSYQEVIDQLENHSNKKLIVAPVASHPLVLSFFNRTVRDDLKKIDLLLPDSQYIRWALKFLYGVKMSDRIYGPRLFIKICQRYQNRDKKILLLGSNAQLTKKSLLKKFPKLRIKIIEIKKDDLFADKEINELRKKIIRLKINLIVIGIGSPTQHQIAVALKINRPTVCVGAAFDFISGRKKQAPDWLGNIGLEWLFRLIQEPKRLGKRYLVDGSIFILLVFRQKLQFLFNLSNRVGVKRKVFRRDR